MRAQHDLGAEPVPADERPRARRRRAEAGDRPRRASRACTGGAGGPRSRRAAAGRAARRGSGARGPRRAASNSRWLSSAECQSTTPGPRPPRGRRRARRRGGGRGAASSAALPGARRPARSAPATSPARVDPPRGALEPPHELELHALAVLRAALGGADAGSRAAAAAPSPRAAALGQAVGDSGQHEPRLWSWPSLGRARTHARATFRRRARTAPRRRPERRADLGARVEAGARPGGGRSSCSPRSASAAGKQRDAARRGASAGSYCANLRKAARPITCARPLRPSRGSVNAAAHSQPRPHRLAGGPPSRRLRRTVRRWSNAGHLQG